MPGVEPTSSGNENPNHVEPTSSTNDNQNCVEPIASKNEKPEFIPCLSNEDILRHINDLQKEKEAWMSLFDDKLKNYRKLVKRYEAAEREENAADDDDDELQDDQIPPADIKILKNDLNFLSQAPDYREFAELYKQVHKVAAVAEAQHDKSMECFNKALQRLSFAPQLKKLNFPRSGS